VFHIVYGKNRESRENRELPRNCNSALKRVIYPGRKSHCSDELEREGSQDEKKPGDLPIKKTFEGGQKPHLSNPSSLAVGFSFLSSCPYN